jgi:hypothetical protein
MAELLLTHARDWQARTPLLVAAECEEGKIVASFKKHGS